MAREGPTDNMVLKQSPRGNKRAHLVAIWEKRIPGPRNKFKGPGAWVSLAYLENSQEEIAQVREKRVAGGEVAEVMVGSSWEGP